ncbi:MAG: hypothetical protein RLZZ306_3340 [Bacteroidota bacterium]|jgi:hypothetical protein
MSTLKHNKIFKDCTHTSADKIYSTNENQKYFTKNKASLTNFCRKRTDKDDKLIKNIKDIFNKRV